MKIKLIYEIDDQVISDLCGKPVSELTDMEIFNAINDNESLMNQILGPDYEGDYLLELE